MKRLLPFVLLLTACGSSSEPDYYTLRAVDGPAVAAAPIRVEVRRAGVPAYLAHPEMTSGSGTVVRRDDGAVWAEPLDRQIERTLALDLTQRLPGSTVFTESGGLTAEPDLVLDVEILGFEPGGSGSRLTVQTAIGGPRRPSAVMSAPRIVEGPSATGGRAMAEAWSVLVGKLADQAAADLAATATPPAPAIPVEPLP